MCIRDRYLVARVCWHLSELFTGCDPAGLVVRLVLVGQPRVAPVCGQRGAETGVLRLALLKTLIRIVGIVSPRFLCAGGS